MNSAIFPFYKIIHFEPAKVPEYLARYLGPKKSYNIGLFGHALSQDNSFIYNKIDSLGFSPIAGLRIQRSEVRILSGSPFKSSLLFLPIGPRSSYWMGLLLLFFLWLQFKAELRQ